MDGAATKIRWSRFLHKQSGLGIIVPIDHGLTMGPIAGLESVERMGSWLHHPCITGIIAHKGMVERLGSRGMLHGLGVMVHLNGMTSLAATPNQKEMLTSIETAIRLGADAVSLQLNFDGMNDAANLIMLGRTVDRAQEYGLPVLTMLYDKVETARESQRLARMRHLMRACVELGTDALKIAAPADLSHLPVLLEGVQEHTKVFFAGGSKCSEEAFLMLAREAVAHGASGLCVGRNVFQRVPATASLDRLWEILLERSGKAPPTPIPFPFQAGHARSRGEVRDQNDVLDEAVKQV